MKYYYLTKWISVLLWFISTNQTMGIQNVVLQPSEMTAQFENNDQTLKTFDAQSQQFEAMPPFPPDYPMPAFPLRGMPYESNDFNLQYQPIMPPIRLDIRVMPPPLYRIEASKPFMPLPPQIPAPYPFVLGPLAATVAKNKTTSTTTDSDSDKDDARINKTRRSVGFTFAPRFYVAEDTETKVIDTWKETEDFRYFPNKWWMGNAKPHINYVKKNVKQYRNKHGATTLYPLTLKKAKAKSVTKNLELPKKIKNMMRIVPLKKEIVREVAEKLRHLQAQDKLSPLVGKLLKHQYGKRGAISKIIDFHTPLKEDTRKINYIKK